MNKLKKVNVISATHTSNLDYNIKNSEIEKKTLGNDHYKYITTQEFNRLTVKNFAVGLKQAK